MRCFSGIEHAYHPLLSTHELAGEAQGNDTATHVPSDIVDACGFDRLDDGGPQRKTTLFPSSARRFCGENTPDPPEHDRMMPPQPPEPEDKGGYRDRRC